jgi:hypothetical protein
VEDVEAGSQIISIGYIGAVNCVGAIRAVAAHSNGRGSDEDRAQRLRFLNGAIETEIEAASEPKSRSSHL